MKIAFILFLSLFLNIANAVLLVPPAPALAAKAYVLYDYSSNQLLVGKNAHDHFQPASLTKLMTAYVTFSALKQGNLSLEQIITPSLAALKVQGEESRMFLEANKPVKIEAVLRGLIVQSGNDAARALAEAIAGSELSFANEWMNKEALRLGLKDTHFVNATGLPAEQHYSSAYDLALLATAVVRDFPEYYFYFSTREFQYNKINQFNRNKLLWLDPYVDGLKTGHTDGAGFCLVASAKRDQHRLISVLLGATSESLRTSESQRLLNHGFQEYELLPLYKKDQSVTEVRVWKGTEKRLNLGFRSDLFVTLPKGMAKQIKAALETRQPLIAPFEKGQVIGTLNLSIAGAPYLNLPLQALESVPLANVFSRGIDSIRLLFE